jgi:hypothetical protein
MGSIKIVHFKEVKSWAVIRNPMTLTGVTSSPPTLYQLQLLLLLLFFTI